MKVFLGTCNILNFIGFRRTEQAQYMTSYEPYRAPTETARNLLKKTLPEKTKENNKVPDSKPPGHGRRPAASYYVGAK
jgi:hypothetical protein